MDFRPFLKVYSSLFWLLLADLFNRNDVTWVKMVMEKPRKKRDEGWVKSDNTRGKGMPPPSPQFLAKTPWLSSKPVISVISLSRNALSIGFVRYVSFFYASRITHLLCVRTSPQPCRSSMKSSRNHTDSFIHVQLRLNRYLCLRFYQSK